MKPTNIGSWIGAGSSVALIVYVIDAYLTSGRDQWGLLVIVVVLQLLTFVDKILSVALRRWEQKPSPRVVYVVTNEDPRDMTAVWREHEPIKENCDWED